MAKPAADVAGFRAGGAKPRLSPAVDPCSDEVVACSISGSPNMETAPRDAGGPRGRARWRRRPAAAFGHGPAAPDARL